MGYEDILFTTKDGVATITINRSDWMNAFRGQPIEEMIHAFNRAGWDRNSRRNAPCCGSSGVGRQVVRHPRAARELDIF